MKRRIKLRIAKAAAILTAVPLLIYAYEYGPDAGFAGVPGENASCIAAGCHTGTANSNGGSVTVTFPNGSTYTPGVVQHLIVTITDPAERRWGFELTARTDPKTMAGSFKPSDGTTQVLCASTNLVSQNTANPNCPANLPLQYMEHSLDGYNKSQTNPGKFEFDWTPPATDVGPVTIYVAGNAANGDLTQNGDHIYTNKYTLTAGAVTPAGPSISSVVNGAGHLDQTAITSGSWVSIMGSNLASGTRPWGAGDFSGGKLPLKLDDVSVTINGKGAVVSYISPNQINVLAPADDSLGAVDVVVTNSGGASKAFSAQLQQFSPAFFLWNDKYVVASQGATWIGPPGLLDGGHPTAPARPGSVVTLWGTGFGTAAVLPADGAPAPFPPIFKLAATPNVVVGGLPAQYLSDFTVLTSQGVYQIVVQLPDSLPDGDQTVQVDIGGVQGPANMFLTIQK
jgi:uncharacterized protein (TIGR03437 family)